MSGDVRVLAPTRLVTLHTAQVARELVRERGLPPGRAYALAMRAAPRYGTLEEVHVGYARGELTLEEVERLAERILAAEYAAADVVAVEQPVFLPGGTEEVWR